MRLYYQLVLYTVLLIGCDQGDQQVQERADSSIAALEQTYVPARSLISPDVERSKFMVDNTVAFDVARAVLETQPPSSGLELERLDLLREGNNNEKLPKFRPILSADTSDGVAVGLRIEQLLFSGKARSAQDRLLAADQIIASLEYRDTLNNRVADALVSIATIQGANRSEQDARALKRRYSNLIAQVEARLAGGIGSSDEVELFRVKALETDNSLAQAQAVSSVAAADFSLQTGGQGVRNISRVLLTNVPNEPLEVSVRRAEVARAQANLAVERIKRRPEFVLIGEATLDPRTREVNDRVGLEMRFDEPLSLGRDTNLRAAEVEVRAAELRRLDSERQLTRQVSTLRTRIEQSQAQLKTLEALVRANSNRADAFQTQFQSGTVVISQAVGILDALRGTRSAITDLRTQILLDQIEIARIQGAFSGVSVK